MAAAALLRTPTYGSREILVLYGSTHTVDSGDIHHTIRDLADHGIRVSVVGVGASLHVCQVLAERTQGVYHVGGDDGSLGTDPLKILQEDPGVGTYIMAFSLLAVATSFIGFVLGLVDFVADGMKLPTNTRSLLPFALTLAPPSIFALLYPDVFLKALDLAGTYGVLAFFGVLPAIKA